MRRTMRPRPCASCRSSSSRSFTASLRSTSMCRIRGMFLKVASIRSRADTSAAAAVEKTFGDMRATANVAWHAVSSTVPGDVLRLIVSSPKGCGVEAGSLTGSDMYGPP